MLNPLLCYIEKNIVFTVFNASKLSITEKNEGQSLTLLVSRDK